MENILREKTISREDFLKQVGIGFGAIVLTHCVAGCTGESIPDQNPATGGFALEVSLNSADFKALNNLGGYAVTTSSGRKIIIARTPADTFIAVQGNCTHANNELTFNGKDRFNCSLHGSQFTTTGSVSVGPASTALKKYVTIFDKTSNTLKVTE